MNTRILIFTLFCSCLNLNASGLDVVDDCDIPSENLQSLKLLSAKDCSEHCQANDLCKGFSFISGWNRCFLKKQVTNQKKLQLYAGKFNQTAISTQKKIIEEGYHTDYIGKDIEKIPHIKDYHECAEKCSQHSQCIAFTYMEGYSDCWLKSNAKSKQSKIFYCGVR